MAKTNTILDTHNTVNVKELQDMINMQLDTIAENPDKIYKLRPLIIRGSPGCGKSSIVKEVCEQRGIEFIDFRAAQCEPCDIRGLPVPNRELNQMDWYVNGVWPRNPNGKGIIFLDEITAADKSIQVALYQLVLDRCLGQLYTVPKGYLIVAAGNNTTDKAVATVLSSAFANRFCHVELKEDAEAWLDWARVNDVHPSVIGFISYKPNMLFNMEGETLDRGWPSPRSWEGVSEYCHICKDETILRKLVYGTVGNGTGVEFMEFYKINEEFINILDIMRNPNAKIEIPDKADRKYALCSSMVYLLWRGKDETDQNLRVDGFYRICAKLSSDFASMALIAAMKGKTSEEQKLHCRILRKNPHFEEWIKMHGKALTKHIDMTKFFN